MGYKNYMKTFEKKYMKGPYYSPYIPKICILEDPDQKYNVIKQTFSKGIHGKIDPRRLNYFLKIKNGKFPYTGNVVKFERVGKKGGIGTLLIALTISLVGGMGHVPNKEYEIDKKIPFIESEEHIRLDNPHKLEALLKKYSPKDEPLESLLDNL